MAIRSRESREQDSNRTGIHKIGSTAEEVEVWVLLGTIAWSAL
jgi:hypothetical protein